MSQEDHESVNQRQVPAERDDTAFFVVLLPMTIAATLGSYLFFAQHSFKRMHNWFNSADAPECPATIPGYL